MELKDFVKETLLQITQGVKQAQKEVAEYDAVINPAEVYGNKVKDDILRSRIKDEERIVQMIDFEVVLTASNEEKTKEGLAVMLGGSRVGGNVTNAGNNTPATNIKFKIPIVLPSINNENKPLKPYIPNPIDSPNRW